MTLEMALITHRLLPGSWFRRQAHAENSRWRLVDGGVEGINDRVRKPVPFQGQLKSVFSTSSLEADDWEVVT